MPRPLPLFLALLLFLAASPARVPAASPPATPAEPAGLEETWQDPATGMDFARVAGGCFKMGCEGGACPADQVPAREVCLDGFYMGRTEVTQAQWTRVMGANPSEFKLGDNYPVERVSFNQAQEFLARLNAQAAGPYRFRLPTEAEWEFLCRSCQDTAPAPAKGRSSPRPAGSGEGACRVQDMAGNVAEWTADVYAKEAYARLGKANPLNTSGGFDRVYRGGCWVGSPERIGCAARFHAAPNTADACMGLRLVMVPDKSRKEDKAARNPAGAADSKAAPGAAPAAAGSGPNLLRKVLLKSEKGELSVEFVTRNLVGGYTHFTLLAPSRFVMDFSGEWASEAALPRDGAVPEIRSVRLGTHPDKLRVVLDFTRDLALTPRFVPTPTGLKVVLAEGAASGGGAGGAPAAQAAAKGTPPASGPAAPDQPGDPGSAKPASGAAPARASQEDGPNLLQKIRAGQEGGRRVVELTTQRPVEEFVYFQPEGLPHRLVVNLPGAWRSGVPDAAEVREGPLERLGLEALPDRLRLTLTFSAKPLGRFQFSRTGGGLVILLPEAFEGAGGAKAPAAAPVPEKPVPEKSGPEKPGAAAAGPEKPAQDPAALDKPAPASPAQPDQAAPQAARSGAKEPAPGREEPNAVETVGSLFQGGRSVTDLVTRRAVGDFSYLRLDNPSRLVVTLPGRWTGAAKDTEVQAGPVRRVGTAVYPDKLIVTLLLDGPAAGRPHVEDAGNGLRIVVEGPAERSGRAAPPADQVEREAVGRKSPARGKTPPASAEPPAEAAGSGVPGRPDRPDSPPEGEVEDQPEAPAPVPAKAQDGDAARTQALEKLKAQLFFSCSMSFASYQTLVWKEGDPSDADLKAKIGPYKQVFRDIALRKGSDEEAWTVINSPIYDLGVELRRQGLTQAVCERLNQPAPEQLERMQGAVKARDPGQVRTLTRQILTAK